MEEIIGNEFIEYKVGFIDGKSKIVEDFLLGKVINLNDDKDILEENNSWYTKGFDDGFNYFSDLINTNKLDLENIDTKNIAKQCFTKRVIEKNEHQDKQIPIRKFRL